MASIIDSFRDTFSDKLSLFKIAIFALPVYITYGLYINSKGDFSGFWWMASVTFILLFGLMSRVAYNVINDKETVLPSLNPIPLLKSSFKGLIAISVPAVISCFAANYFCSLINFAPWLDTTMKVLIWAVAASVILTSFLMFVKKESIKDAYDFKIIFEEAGDFIWVILIFLIQLVVVNIPTVAFIGYVILILFGFGWLFDAYVSLAFVFNIAVIGHYLGQVQFEVLEYKRNSRLN